MYSTRLCSDFSAVEAIKMARYVIGDWVPYILFPHIHNHENGASHTFRNYSYCRENIVTP